MKRKTEGGFGPPPLRVTADGPDRALRPAERTTQPGSLRLLGWVFFYLDWAFLA